MTARLSYWYLTHPRWGRPLLALGVLQALAVVAVCTAPAASASTNAMVLNWTGLRDSYGVPIGNYYLAIATARERIVEGAAGVDWNPLTWMQYTLHVIESVAFTAAAANVLTAEAGLFVGTVALALWLMKITVSTWWLSVIGEIARAVSTAVVQVTTALGLVVLAVPIGVFAGAVTVFRGEVGRGWTMIGIALSLPALSVAVFADPAGLMYGPDGVLAFARRVGFSVAQAATHNGSFAETGSGVEALTASLITHTVREPLQLWNFGHVVDRVGGCGPAWSAAVNQGAPDGPIRAMEMCGNAAAAAYAQHLDGTNIWVGLVFVGAAMLLGLFMVASGWMVLSASVKAIWTTVILLPSLWLGAIPGAPQRRAVDVVWQFFRHGIEVLVYIVFVSVMGLAVESIVSGPLPAELGGTNPFAHVLMMGAVSVAALLLLRYIRADLGGRRRGPGLFRQASHVAVGMGMQAAVAGAGGAAAAGVGGLRQRFGRGGGATPWEQLDGAAGNARVVHGGPQPGFDPVPNPAAGGFAAGGVGDVRGGGAAAGGVADVGGGGGSGGAASEVPAAGGVAQSAGGGGSRGHGGSRDGAGLSEPDVGAEDVAVAGGDGPSAATASAVPPVTFFADPRFLGEVPPPPEDEPPPRRSRRRKTMGRPARHRLPSTPSPTSNQERSR